MLVDTDFYGTYRKCMQCGHMLDVQRPNGLLSIQTSDANPERKKKSA